MREQKRLDRPELREKIVKKLMAITGTSILLGSEVGKFNTIADQILALIPDIEEERDKVAEIIKGLLTPEEVQGRIEEAKREERERILDMMVPEKCDLDTQAYFTPYYWLDEDAWQALKEEK